MSRLKSGIKKAIGLGEKKPKTPPVEARNPAKMFPDEPASPARTGERPRRDGPRRDRPARAEGDERGPRPDRPAREPREPRGDRPPREPRGDRPAREPRGDRPARGDRPDGRGPRRGEKPARERDAGDSKPRENFEALPPPPAPPAPEGPFPEAFEVLGLSPAVLAAIRETGYEKPTQIQAEAIPVVMEGRDVVGASQTGTGKTAAFALPTLSRMGAPGKFRCLVLEPTRELAAQVVEQFEKYGKHTGLRVLLVHGGVGYEKQRKGLQQGVDVVVATPGRLLDFMQDGTANLENLEVLILDEVDRMLDMGFLPDVRRIVERTPKSRQTLFFSATMPPQIKTLAEFALKDPTSIEIGIRFSPAETVSHYMYPVASDQRQELLLAILKKTHFASLMIFTRTKAQADQLYSALQQEGEYKVAVMHSDIRQSERERALKGFRDGEFEVIVATDLAARGLDISGVTHVINYMVPENSEDYVHRIGRTGRAQKEGDAYTMFSAEELPSVASIERLINQKIERKKLEGFTYKYTTVLDEEDKARAILHGRGKKKRR
ncbi:superfamily II DNA/RNA helicase [Prosthecobacter fusiformis]|uniref:DEAD-box ATP-dependent RNA helicase RhpA n=1 Tax=Prosthecobacter fusiformis TaxID=48464 RepID=A0A4R7RY53_9BACT|nr:DEAD/DEAH box helicase [Prosthecobacter fusiformis]TDU70782.1 superfamily II DNA/RNA helicase [Prosthecobacter fusiformis]